MPRKSRSDNVRKICKCAKWKTCAHPWYLDYQRDKVRYRDNLDKLTGNWPFAKDAAIKEAFYPELQAAVLGEKNAAEALEAAERKVNRILSSR